MTLMTIGSLAMDAATGPAPHMVERTTTRTLASSDRIGVGPHRADLGPADDVMTLSGVVYAAHIGTIESIDMLRAIQAQGVAHVVTDGLGNVRGKYHITTIRETADAMLDGAAPRRQQFVITLTRSYDD